MSGSTTRARASAMRCRWPPESLSGRVGDIRQAERIEMRSTFASRSAFGTPS